MSLTFLITSLVVVATPGTGALYTVSEGLSRGARAGVLAAFACTLGIIPHLFAAITGLAGLLNTSAIAFQVVKYLGVAYLLYLAWSTWRDDSVLEVTSERPPQSARRVLIKGVLINLLNPKLTLFFFAFLPQFVPPDDPAYLWQMAAYSAVFMAMTFVVFALYGVFAAVMRSQVISRPRVIHRLRQLFAASFVALGARLATTSR